MTEIPYINRDLSWLSFNERILMEAADASLPVYERLKFLAIYSSNLDEFFRVRVASIQQLLKLKKKKQKKLQDDPQDILMLLLKEVRRQQEWFGRVFREQLIPELEKHQIELLLGCPEDEEQLAYIQDYFSQEMLPYVHPELLLRGKIAHFMRDRSVYLALRMVKNSGKTATKQKRNRYATVLIPSHRFPRFLTLPSKGEKHQIMFIDDVVRAGLNQVFPGFEVQECYGIKLSRNADLQIEDELDGNLPEKIKNSLTNRQVGLPARFLYDHQMPESMLEYLQETYQLNPHELVPGGRYHHFSDLFTLPNPVGKKLEGEAWTPLLYAPFENVTSVFQAIAEEDHLLHFPYHCYDPVIRFLNEAATDTQVTQIETTQYRVANHSAVVDALIRAARNGKKVRVFVEIKARFDEASNLRTAQAMAEAGVEVIYSMPNLKVHAKVALVTREESGRERGYAFLSTGNFNEKTAQLYGDHGLFTADKRLIKELHRVFCFLQHKEAPKKKFQHLLVAQFNIKEELIKRIDREIALAKEGKDAYMLLKMNNLEEKEMVAKLYEASQAGVKIDLLLRGICTVVPQRKGYSENIKVTRIIDCYLEHARVFLFRNSGANDLFMGSADWMDRNLNRRIEVVFPVYKPRLKAEILHILDLQLKDNVKAVWLDEKLNNIRKGQKEDEPFVRSQEEIYNWLKNGAVLLE